MATFVDFPAIKETVQIEDVFDLLELSMKPHGATFRGACPACNQGGDRALIVTPEKKAYYCFGAKKGGDVIAFVAHVKGIGQREAGQLLQEQFLRNRTVTRTVQATSTSSRRRQPQENKQAPAPAAHRLTSGLSPLDYLEAEHEAVEALGLTAEDGEKLGAGYANRGVLRGLVAIPLRTEDGVLVGYFGAAEGRFGKLNFPNVVPFKKRA